MNAFAYLRVSTDKQADSGLGLEAQQASVAACSTRLGLPIRKTFTDAGTSGALTIEDRPVLLDAVSALRRGDVLIVAKRDRLGRDVIAVALIERLVAKRGGRIVSAAGEGTENDDPAGMLMRRLIDSFAEYERALIAARTRAALQAKRRKGERVSGIIPFGYDLAQDGRTLKPKAREQAMIASIRALRAAGGSLREVAEEMNKRGARTRSGRPWRFEYVRNVLRHQPIPA
jgi:DNA invertase Pin-like site-specific DNA recombinase